MTTQIKKATLLTVGLFALAAGACSSAKKPSDTDSTVEAESRSVETVSFDADSAFAYVKAQTEFGPRVNNTEAHRKCGEWLCAELERHGAEVTRQEATLRSFDGVDLQAVNIIGQFNPEAENRLLLLAHWDTRPWADNDPDESKHKTAIDGANDGGSGVGVLLEIARQLGHQNPGKGVDILFVDAEDRGASEDEESWALGARYFVEHPFKEGYRPDEAILLDMVGGREAKFAAEYFSLRYAQELLQKVWRTAAESGYDDYFVTKAGGAITDDHIHFLKVGIPTIDIIEYNEASGTGFNPTWHTTHDTIDNIDRATLKAVGQTVVNYIYK